ncbi:FAD-dependent oxidoreductase [Solibacillus sp. FSL H8-0538]|uniref:FAD-dependent oxidoreductase n=1 Tax=Solibacillus sp. FSL H8-0538 TaxID=2921400 RepID=UPI0030F91CD3
MRHSIWLDNFTALATPTLANDMRCQVCIIGGGLSGIYTAYLLAKSGVDVVLVEAQATIAHGATAYSTGKLTAQHDIIYSKLTEAQGKMYYSSNKSAIDAALTTNPPSFSLATSYLYTTTEEGQEKLKQEAEAYKKIGIPMVATKEVELALPIQLALGMKNEGQINPAEFTTHFAKLARKEGAQLFTDTRVITIDAQDKIILTHNDYTISYDKLILCTHYPIESIKGLYSAKLQVSRSYLMATETTELLNGQYISIDEQSRTMRTALIGQTPYFIYGGSAHLAGTESNTDKFYDTLRSELTGQFDLPEPSFMWSAQDVMTPDNLPYIGQLTESEDTIYIATGYRKWGLSTSLVAGEILNAAITGTAHPAAELYAPSRSAFGRKLYFMLTTGGFISEQLIAGYVTRMDTPRCTHLGCKTRWNKGDETWDCPCHGSRYDKHGQVIEGPAVYPLKLKKTDER